MTAATVLIPTHSHAEPLRHAVASVQEQSLQDFELFIVGDGVTEATRRVVTELSATDRRIRFFDFPKAPRKGELLRHQALQHAQGRFVAYLGDDDCWMSDHLQVLDALLTEADFGHTLQLGINAEGQIVVMPVDLQSPAIRNRMLTELFNRFDMTFAGHTLEAYRRLPYGWRTTPPEFPWSDLYMWRQFLAEPWCRTKSAMVPTAINTWTHLRPELSDQERADYLAHWRTQASAPVFRERLCRDIAQRLADKCVKLEQGLAQHMAAYSVLESAHARMQAELKRSQAETEQARIHLRRLESERAARPAMWSPIS